jgi:hypothetical protein
VIVTAENGVVAEIVSIILTQFCVGVGVVVNVDVTEGVIPLTEEERVGVLVKVVVDVGVTPVIEIVPVGVLVTVGVGVGWLVHELQLANSDDRTVPELLWYVHEVQLSSRAITSKQVPVKVSPLPIMTFIWYV